MLPIPNREWRLRNKRSARLHYAEHIPNPWRRWASPSPRRPGRGWPETPAASPPRRTPCDPASARIPAPTSCPQQARRQRRGEFPAAEDLIDLHRQPGLDQRSRLPRRRARPPCAVDRVQPEGHTSNRRPHTALRRAPAHGGRSRLSGRAGPGRAKDREQPSRRACRAAPLSASRAAGPARAWVKAGRYWVAYNTTQPPVIVAVFYETANIPARL